MLITAARVNEIANAYYDDIYGHCLLRLRKDYDASDVTQEVFLLFQQRYRRLDDSHIKAWLYSVADYKIKEQFRAIAKREKELIFNLTPDSQESEDLVYEMDDYAQVTDEEIEEKKKSILDSLTEKELKLFEMVYIKHLEYKELAKALNITESTARTRVYRLRLKIKEKASFMFMALLLLLMKL